MPPLPPNACQAATPSAVADQHYGQAIKLEDAGETQAALKEFDIALQAKPGDVMCQIGQARCYSRLGLHARATTLLTGLSVSRPKDIMIWLNLAVVSLAAGEVQPAVKAIEHALSIDPNSTTAIRILAEISFLNGQYPAAATLAARLIDLAPQNRDGYILMAQCCRKLKAGPEDMDNLIEAAKDNVPGDGDLFFTLAKSARNGARTAIEVDKFDQSAHHAWWQVTEKGFTYAVEAEPNNIHYRLDLIKLLKHNHKLASAKTHLEIAKKIAPKNLQLWAIDETFKPSQNDIAGRVKEWMREFCKSDKAKQTTAATRTE